VPNDESPKSEDATQIGFTDYWRNTNLANQKVEKVKSPATTLLAGDGNDGCDATNARYGRSTIPRAWMGNENSPARRHLGTGNYLFADGHVKAMKPTAIKPKSSQGPSFALK
jgi:prepilin-type processing-associated H-X9-DG protein